MPEWLIRLFVDHPGYTYALVGVIFVLCGLGLPIPEEIVLVTCGYICFQKLAIYWVMATVCSAAILTGDVVPFLLGRAFGPRLLRLRVLRFVVNRDRLTMFDRWFRRRGDMVILIARFIPGLRVVAFFTGGTMRMRWLRFLMLDIAGIVLTAPLMVYLGFHFGNEITGVVQWVRQVEGSILYSVAVAAALLAGWYWLRRRARRRRRMAAGPAETFVRHSTRELQAAAHATDPAESAADADAAPQTGERAGATPPRTAAHRGDHDLKN
ncbi:MAG: DedA family protein [Planctomycetes bacterium]|nr:DedA family protein [Planctomycetota bacterium]MCB9871479.1 DedA family protein [Planctomycetota bacterium]